MSLCCPSGWWRGLRAAGLGGPGLWLPGVGQPGGSRFGAGAGVRRWIPGVRGPLGVRGLLVVRRVLRVPRVRRVRLIQRVPWWLGRRALPLVRALLRWPWVLGGRERVGHPGSPCVARVRCGTAGSWGWAAHATRTYEAGATVSPNWAVGTRLLQLPRVLPAFTCGFSLEAPWSSPGVHVWEASARSDRWGGRSCRAGPAVAFGGIASPCIRLPVPASRLSLTPGEGGG